MAPTKRLILTSWRRWFITAKWFTPRDALWAVIHSFSGPVRLCVCTEVEIEPDSSPDSLAKIIDSQHWFIDLRRPLNNSSFWRSQTTWRVVQSAKFVRVVIYAFRIYFNRPGPLETLTGSLRWISDCQFTFIALHNRKVMEHTLIWWRLPRHLNATWAFDTLTIKVLRLAPRFALLGTSRCH